MTISRFGKALLPAILVILSVGGYAQSQMVEDVHVATLVPDSLLVKWQPIEGVAPMYQVRVEINEVIVFEDSTTDTKSLYLPQAPIEDGDHVVVAVKEAESPGFTTVDLEEILLPNGGSGVAPIIIVDVIYMRNTECPPLVITNNAVTLCPSNELDENGLVKIVNFQGEGRDLLVKRSKICGCLSSSEGNYWQYFSSCLVRP